uniref:Uncharacterized protein n=1 Tax=Sinocyclocheilus grahami TaxID=75366 RepID=A0A672NR77_SINGR
MRTLSQLMSSPSLSDLIRSERSALDDRNNQQHRAGTNATWNRVNNAVLKCNKITITSSSVCVCVCMRRQTASC